LEFGESGDDEAAGDFSGEGEETGVEGSAERRGDEVGYLGGCWEAGWEGFGECFALGFAERSEVWIAVRC